MKKLILVGLMLGALANNLFAYKVYKERDHWGIFGGFSAIEEKTFGHIGADGSFVIDVVYLKCMGSGSDNCTYQAMPVTNDGGVFGQAGEGILNGLFAKAETQQAEGVSSGSFTETHAILQPDGTYRYFYYTTSWSGSSPSTIEIDITALTN